MEWVGITALIGTALHLIKSESLILFIYFVLEKSFMVHLRLFRPHDCYLPDIRTSEKKKKLIRAYAATHSTDPDGNNGPWLRNLLSQAQHDFRR